MDWEKEESVNTSKGRKRSSLKGHRTRRRERGLNLCLTAQPDRSDQSGSLDSERRGKAKSSREACWKILKRSTQKKVRQVHRESTRWQQTWLYVTTLVTKGWPSKTDPRGEKTKTASDDMYGGRRRNQRQRRGKAGSSGITSSTKIVIA